MPAKDKKARPIVLSIAGYDPSSGAGITADIKTMAAHRCYGVTCITSLTVQSTQGVKRVEHVDGRVITETLEELLSDFSISAVRIGMLGSAEAARAVAAFVRRNQLGNVVLDPILKSSSGADLISRDGAAVMKERMLSLVHVITPNIDEASALTGLPVGTPEQAEAAARRLHEMGVRNVIITGGHLDPPSDFVSLAGGRENKWLEGKKVEGRSTHGTGCAFSTALACNLALGLNLLDAARAAKQYVANALRKAVQVGKGRGPINHLFDL